MIKQKRKKIHISELAEDEELKTKRKFVISLDIFLRLYDYQLSCDGDIIEIPHNDYARLSAFKATNRIWTVFPDGVMSNAIHEIESVRYIISQFNYKDDEDIQVMP